MPESALDKRGTEILETQNERAVENAINSISIRQREVCSRTDIEILQFFQVRPGLP